MYVTAMQMSLACRILVDVENDPPPQEILNLVFHDQWVKVSISSVRLSHDRMCMCVYVYKYGEEGEEKRKQCICVMAPSSLLKSCRRDCG